MHEISNLALLSLVITAAALFGWISDRILRVPQTIGSMGLTVVCSVALISLSGLDPRLHLWFTRAVGQVDLRNLILHGWLGLLLFAGAFLLDLDMLRQERVTVGTLAFFATLLSTAGVAVFMHATLPLLGLTVPWVQCLLFGALISPTDPIAVLEMLGRIRVSRVLEAQLAGESLFNDGVGAVLFLALLAIAEGRAPTPAHVAGQLLWQSGGGLLLGVVLAWLASEMMSRVDRYQVEILMTLALALGGYAMAEQMHLSAPLEAVAAGLALRRFNANHTRREIAHEDLKRFWTLVDEVQNALLFVLIGLEVLAISFARSSVAAGAVAIVAVALVRVVSVALVLLAVRALAANRRADRPPFGAALLTLTWGGLRGGLSIALALSVPLASGRGWMLAATYVVVVFSVLVQGGTLGKALQWRPARAT